MEDVFSQMQRKKTIHMRIKNKALNAILKKELIKRNIVLDYKYGVYQNKLATYLKSDNYEIKIKNSFNYPLFKDTHGNSDYELFVTFPNERRYLLSEMMSIFINNVSHEFKTPIATINLALDSIKNPKIIKNEEKIKRYVKMIRDENKRMHSQVENVLNISKLEKKQLEIKKEVVNAHNIIEEAIEHINLLVLEKKGVITTHFEAIITKILRNEFYLTNCSYKYVGKCYKIFQRATKN